MRLEKIIINGKEELARVTQIGRRYIIQLGKEEPRYICRKKKGQYICDMVILNEYQEE